MALPPLSTVKKLDAKAKPDSKEYKEAEEALKKAYNTAFKAASMLGFDIKAKPPVAAKILPMMQKEGKPAEFVVTGDKGKVFLSIQSGNFKSVLGLYDVASERDIEKQRDIYENLYKSGLGDKKTLDDFNKKHTPGGNPNSNLEKMKKNYQNMDFRTAMENPKIYLEFKAFGKANHNEENFFFEDAMRAKRPPGAMVDVFIKADAKYEINISAQAKKKILDAQMKDALSHDTFKEAHKVVQDLIRTNLFERFRAQKVKEVEKQIEAAK